MKAVLPVTDGDAIDDLALMYCSRGGGDDDDDDDDSIHSSLPFNPYGAIFLRCVKLVQVPRMRVGGPGLSSKAFKHLFGRSEDAVVHQYNRVGIMSREQFAERRVGNKSKRTVTYIPESNAVQPVLFDLERQKLKLPPPAADGGSDLEGDEESAEEDSGIDAVITQLYRQFLIDVMQKVPNPRGMNKRPYCVLDMTARLRATEDLYNNPRLPDVWNACYYMKADIKQYQAAFDHLFPPRDHLTSPKVQNYLQCQYYMKWKQLCASSDSLTVGRIRREIRRRVFKLAWLPHPCQDRIWATKGLKGFTRYPLTSDVDASAPRILMRKDPEW